jgi:SH3-like domain-containing protein
MQKLLKKTILLAISAFAALASTGAEEAIVDEGKINVRGQPSLIGEVVTQLQRGDKVTVLERVKVENPKPGEPVSWAKIKLPENTPVWVFSPFVKDGVVSATRLNLRAGPGENYSVVGRLERGAPVKSIRTIEEWMEIEAPLDAFAFVDDSLLKTTGGEAAAPAIAAALPQSEPTNNAAITTTPPALAPAIVESVPSEDPTPAIVAAAPVVTPAQPLPQVAPPPAQKLESTPGKRLVRREGVIRPTKSIQAPTWYELVHPVTKITINYLNEEKLGINLKGYRGQKVIVSGEEGIDSRWPNTPIIELESLDIAP